MTGEAKPVTVSFEIPSVSEIAVSGSQAAYALLLNRAERRKKDFIFVCYNQETFSRKREHSKIVSNIGLCI